MRFWLGTHRPNWLSRTDVGLMVSHRTLGKYKRLPVAVGPWVLDSGGFSELSMYGEWRTTENDYARAVQRFNDEIGNLEWVAPQDWMCEPWIIKKKGLTVEEHQRRTVDNFLSLCSLGVTNCIPVLQGWERGDYLNHVRMYGKAGIHLGLYDLVGIGSVCRRSNKYEIIELVRDLTNMGIKLHGFGVKRAALSFAGYLFESADSLAWSYTARYQPPLVGCSHKTCNNCLAYALAWRERTLRAMDFQQPQLDFSASRCDWCQEIVTDWHAVDGLVMCHGCLNLASDFTEEPQQ